MRFYQRSVPEAFARLTFVFAVLSDFDGLKICEEFGETETEIAYACPG